MRANGFALPIRAARGHRKRFVNAFPTTFKELRNAKDEANGAEAAWAAAHGPEDRGEDMNNALERLKQSERALDAERRLLNEALTSLGETEKRSVARLIARRAGRLIFGLDLTGSREPGLKQARIATAAMFDAIRNFGSVEVKLVYYRGTDECRESSWYTEADVLRRSMLQLSCERGRTQIAKLLNLVLAQNEKPSAVVFVGDHCEEEDGELVRLAARLGEKHVPLFVFHECADHDDWSLRAKPVFRRMAEITGGVYVEFKPDSGDVLRELLPAVGAFSAAGAEGVERIALPVTTEARRLRSRLLLSSGDNGR